MKVHDVLERRLQRSSAGSNGGTFSKNFAIIVLTFLIYFWDLLGIAYRSLQGQSKGVVLNAFFVVLHFFPLAFPLHIRAEDEAKSRQNAALTKPFVFSKEALFSAAPAAAVCFCKCLSWAFKAAFIDIVNLYDIFSRLFFIYCPSLFFYYLGLWGFSMVVCLFINIHVNAID